MQTAQTDPIIPPEPCPFCKIAITYPAAATAAPHDEDVDSFSLRAAIPTEPDSTLLSPNCFLILSAARVMAFLDIMPLARGHVLVATRAHKEKAGDMGVEEGRDVGFWLPLISKAVVNATGVDAYNIVQNNGIQAAQVVPHVHFHIIPRPDRLKELQSRSFTMFGRGLREDLDEEEAEVLARELRKELTKVVEGVESKGQKMKL